MSKRKTDIGLVICTCVEKHFSRAELQRIIARMEAEAPVEEALCAAGGLDAACARLKKKGWDRLLVAGCCSQRHAELLPALARACGLAASAVQGVDLGLAARVEDKTAEAVRALRKGLEALRLQPPIATQKVPLEPTVLVVGAGAAGVRAAAALSALGHPVVLVERRADRGAEILRQMVAGRAPGAGKAITLLAGSRVRRLEGQIGRFKAFIQTPQGESQLACGAVVLATGAAEASSLPPAASPFDGRTVLPLEELAGAASSLPARRGVRSLAVVLDYRIDETKASMEAALKLALSLQRERGFQVHLLCRDARVSAMDLEKLYDQAREAGVDIVKFEGPIRIGPAAQGDRVALAYRDAVLRSEVRLECELAGLSPLGVLSAAEAETAAVFGVSLDPQGQMQPNNIHLFPGETNRPGIFVAGSCRGQYYEPQALREAEAAALAVHALLAPGFLVVELAQPVVDAEKCALCLTCVRSCPHQAMYVDREKGAAASSPEACRRCGICAGECPAKAIELPAWSDSILLSQVG